MSTDPTQFEGVRILQELIARAVVDKSYRQQLIDDPTQELEGAGLVVPKGVNVFVHVNTDTEIHVVIPACPPLVPNEKNVLVLFSSHHWV